jgi:hypothetical protein
MTDMTKKTDYRIWTGDKKAFILPILNIVFIVCGGVGTSIEQLNHWHNTGK